jgi:AcrR family transcriptional regulator
VNTRKPHEQNPEDARMRLLQAGLRLFAGQGFAKTSTREIAEAASVNVAAISYYFGDKAGLYRAVFFGPVGEPEEDLARLSQPDAPLEMVLRGFFEAFLAPLREGDTARLCMKLRFREMFEPTGLWEEEVERGIKPMHDTMAKILAHHLGLAEADDEIARLVVCLAGLGVHLHVGHDINQQVAPALGEGADAVERWAGALVRYGLALVQAEATRRGVTLRPAAPGVAKT